MKIAFHKLLHSNGGVHECALSTNWNGISANAGWQTDTGFDVTIKNDVAERMVVETENKIDSMIGKGNEISMQLAIYE